MTRIAQEDLKDSLFEALQFISHHHPVDFLRALRRAWEAETHPPARAAIEQLLINSRLGALGRRPLCQDTGVVQVFLRVGAGVQFIRRDNLPLRSLQAVVDDAVRAAYTDPVNPLRATMVADTLGRRLNTRDNTPAVVFTEIVEGDRLEVLVAAKGGGGDVKARFATLNPSDNVADWVLAQLPGMGAGWCPPGVLGVGIGGSPEQAMLLAKLSLFDPIDIDLLERNEPLPVQLRDRVVYYAGPVDAVAGEAVGPAGPTTATRMDKFVEPLLAGTGLLAMIGKAERGPEAIASIRRHGAAYLCATGGAAICYPSRSAQPGWWHSRIWAWRRSGSSSWSTSR